MTSKERVYAALAHKQPDRTPRFIWLGNGVADRLMQERNVTSAELDAALGNDILQTWLSINREMEVSMVEGEERVDEWGITWRRSGWHNMVISHPLASLSAEEIAMYPFPKPLEPTRYTRLQSLLSTYGNTHFIGADISGSLFEPAYHLRGMDTFLMDLALESEEAQVLLDKLEAFTTQVAVHAVELGVDWIWLGDDMGTQNAMIMSPTLWRTNFKPRMVRIINAIRKAKPNMTVAYHSCGSMAPIIPDLVEIGINVLNPLQESAQGINHKEVKDRYGDVLTLMCGLDTQTFLLQATPEEVTNAVKEKAKRLGENGGFIFAASHHIQHDTPEENITAFFAALDEV